MKFQQCRRALGLSFLLALCGLLHKPLAAVAQMSGSSDNSQSNNTWLIYKGDLQRTGAVNVRLGSAPNLIWRYSSDIAPKEFDTTPLVVGPPSQRRIYFAADKYVVCLDGQTGNQIWRSKPLQRPITSPIALVSGETGDMILAVTSSGQLNALRTTDGGQLWQVPASAPVQNIAPVLIPTAGGERILLALATGRLVTFTLSGQPDPSWELKLGSFSATPTATPALSPDKQFLYIPTQDKKLYVVDIASAKVAFPIGLDTAAFTPPLVVEDNLVVVTGTTLQGMKLRTGQTKWRFDVKSSLGTASAVAGVGGEPGTVFVGARNGKFFGINVETGARIWETDLADSVTGVPVITQDMVLIGTRNGLMFGLSPTDGKVLWRYRLHTRRAVVRNDWEDDGRTRGNETPPSTGFGNAGFGNTSFGGTPPVAPTGTTDAGGNEAATTWQTFGVSSMPAIVGDTIYVLGDNAAMYAFSTQPFDADPPQVLNPMLSIPNSAGKPALMRMDADKPLLVPGRAPLQFVAELSDVGSGVDPDSIRVSLNKQELPKIAIAPFSDITGKLLVTIAESKTRVTLNLEDGLYNVTVTARDYRGNELNYTGNFLVDNTVPPPAAAPVILDDDGGNNDRNR